MHETIDRLIRAYESGATTRRQLVAALAALGVAGRARAAEAAAPAPLPAVRINHINLRVSDLRRSVDFYQKLFGPRFRQFATMLPYDLGGGSMVPYMSVQNDKDVTTEGRMQYEAQWHRSLTTRPGTWEHVAFEVDGLDVERTVATLKAAGSDATVSGGFVWTHDPDGALIQIVDASSGGAKVGQKLEPLKPADLARHE